MQTNLRHSRQREAILSYLKSTKEHPTAEMVYDSVRKTYPHLSLGTVYRNLSLLFENDVILKFNCGDGVERFDANAHNHYHFYCNECKNVYDVELEIVKNIDKAVEKELSAEVFSHFLCFKGICNNCKK